MKTLHTSFECYPLSKVGGLADVVGALPKYLNESGCSTAVITPYFDKKSITNLDYDIIFSGTLYLGTQNFNFDIRTINASELGFPVYLVSIPDLLFRTEVYGYPDDTERFLGFQLAILEWLTAHKDYPDFMHCHDHHTALIPFLISQSYRYKVLSAIRTILTIHNAQYQGHFGYDRMNYIPEFNFEKAGLLDWYDSINPLAAGIKCATRVTTVSPSYMQELQLKANGLEGLLSSEHQKCIGILNGIDTDVWNPKIDPMLIKQFDHRNLVSGRKENKKWLCEKFDLDLQIPLFAFIGRLVYEKGADLLPEIFSNILENMECNILVLGSGEKDVEEKLTTLQRPYQGKYNAFIGYDEKLSHIIYGGSDFLLMPSRVEPCGLNQLYALRYGSIPIVRRTGGLKDTVTDIGDNGFGICHDQASVFDVCYSIERGIALYIDQKNYKETQKRIVKIDHSWNHSAAQYIQLYKSLKSKK